MIELTIEFLLSLAILFHLTIIRQYRVTVAGRGYDNERKRQLKPELHFTVARRGSIRNVRRQLAKRGVDYYQQRIHREYGIWIPKNRIRVGFEREGPAKKTERSIRIEGLTFAFTGKRTTAVRMASRALSFAKKKQKR